MKIYTLILLFVFLSSCSTRHSVPLDSIVDKDVRVDTISSNILISSRIKEKNITSRGMLFYRRPDNIRLIVFSPFGSTIFDSLFKDDVIKVYFQTDSILYSGKFKELSGRKEARAWGMLVWALDFSLKEEATSSERKSSLLFHGTETIYFKDRLLSEKRLAGGESVKYLNYKVVAGVNFPMEILYSGGDEERIRIQFEDPEINLDIPASSFSLSRRVIHNKPLSELSFQ